MPKAAARAAPFLLLSVVLSACPAHRATDQPGDHPGADETFVPALGIALTLPPGTEAEYLGPGATFFVPHDPATRVFAIEEWPSAPVHTEPPSPAMEKTLPDGATVRYLVQQLGEGEAALSGALQLGPATFAIHCHDRALAPAKPDPTWCLSLLGTLRLTGRQ